MIHAIRGFIAPDSGMTESQVQAAIDDWVSKRAKWSDGDWEANVGRVNTSPGGSGDDYLMFSVRFEWSTSKDNTLQKCADKFKNKVAWFELVYHVCDHDENDRGGCSWDERWSWGSGIPPAVEQLVPNADTEVSA